MLQVHGQVVLGVRAMEEQYYADRAQLRQLLHAHPDWPPREFAAQIGRSVGWVKRWRTRLRTALPDDDRILGSQWRARKQPLPAVSPLVVERILEIRDHRARQC